MQKQVVEGLIPPERDVQQTVGGLESTRKMSKKAVAPRTAQEESDMHLLRVIRCAFSELSSRGKGLCAEELVRELAKEKV